MLTKMPRQRRWRWERGLQPASMSIMAGVLEMFMRLLIRTVKRHECRAPQTGGTRGAARNSAATSRRRRFQNYSASHDSVIRADKIIVGRTMGEKRRRAAALQDARANTGGARIARSVLECASPLALWEGGRDARSGAKLFHLFDDEYLVILFSRLCQHARLLRGHTFVNICKLLHSLIGKRIVLVIRNTVIHRLATF